MRQEEKEVDGPEIEHEEERKRESELVEEKEDEIHDLDGKPYEMDGQRDKDRSGMVVGAMRKILEGEQIVINDLKLPQRELKALEALQTAKRGRDGQLDQFVYAEDRRALLEQALAVLQPDIVTLEKEAGQPFEELMKDVAGLRDKLNVLEDSEEELFQRRVENEKGETDSDDKPKPSDDDQTLSGPERKVEKKTSDLGGAERKIDKPKSTLDGPEVKEEKKAKSTLDGPEVKEEKKPTTLTGGEAKEPKKPDTSLGEPKEIDDAQKKLPWWKAGSSRG
ncbi:MAG TPA: hypothetical protein VMZ53_11110 [Kofleriaceae bacterium]|nr:hypothetical protein [Kofleriaceae bacterium]